MFKTLEPISAALICALPLTACSSDSDTDSSGDAEMLCTFAAHDAQAFQLAEDLARDVLYSDRE
ncbi:MAG: hypothetical protein AAGC55_11045 [Myxococcota bacterium]